MRTVVSTVNMLITERGQDPKAGSRDMRGEARKESREITGPYRERGGAAITCREQLA